MTLLSSIHSTGSQSYDNLSLATTAAGLRTTIAGSNTISLTSQNANISLLGTIDGVAAKTQSLRVDAGTANVTLGDSVGSLARLNSIDITGRSIYVLADILTATSQTYNGNVFIGDATYLNKPRVLGFLFNNYRNYFEYQRGALVSTIDYLNTNPQYIRTMISEDPSVVFNGAVNDVTANTHTLLVAAIAPSIASASSSPPVIVYGEAVGAIAPLYSINSQTAINHSGVPASSSSQYVGSISIVGGASTFSSQTYSTASMTASALSSGGQVTFSVYDPNSSVTFLLPTHSTNGVDQLNLYNGNAASLAIYGSSNYANNPNTGSASDQWSAPTLGNALGYVAPVSNQAPPLNIFMRTLDSGSLREAIDFHADQVQMTVDERALVASVSVSAPVRTEVIRSRAATGNTLIKKDGGDAICSADDKGDLNCGD
jgi:hypothetical protein